jgi:hypothetical protein
MSQSSDCPCGMGCQMVRMAIAACASRGTHYSRGPEVGDQRGLPAAASSPLLCGRGQIPSGTRGQRIIELHKGVNESCVPGLTGEASGSHDPNSRGSVCLTR